LVQYGFLIDHRRCIGCHACTVACKAENDVPVGNFRTWVKYQENGTFPAVKRNFAVLRCNHCTAAPCVTICPVTALSKQTNGVVDIDRDVCIGCRACMQACPYDALHLNEDDGCVEKCHFCNHRLDQGLEPACVVVCPEQAIIPGDLHDPESKISRMVKELKTEVRRPEQNTGPNVHYVGHEPTILQPGAAKRPPLYLWSDRPASKPEAWPSEVPTLPNVRTVLDAGHKVEWGFGVSTYLVTKAVAAGAAIQGLLHSFVAVPTGWSAYVPEILALVFTTITTILLVEDLKRPLLFLTLLTRPNTKSWLVKGAWILIAFSLLTTAIVAARFFDHGSLANALRWPNALLGAAAAGYTAFLFKQCEGRDLWQRADLLPKLLLHALLAGAFALVPFYDTPPLRAHACVMAIVVVAAMWAFRFITPKTDNERQASGFLHRIRIGSLPAEKAGLALILLGAPLALVAPAIAWIPVLVGLLLTEHAFIRAGQLPPLS
jgi:Fe-S-cluster-containing dehydrogenase component